jgi:hypothetical protein
MCHPLPQIIKQLFIAVAYHVLYERGEQRAVTLDRTNPETRKQVVLTSVVARPGGIKDDLGILAPVFTGQPQLRVLLIVGISDLDEIMLLAQRKVTVVLRKNSCRLRQQAIFVV